MSDLGLPTKTSIVTVVFAMCLAVGIISEARSTDGQFNPPTRLRRPVAVVVVEDGSRALVANRRSGSVSTIDVLTRRVVAETEVATTLSDLVVSPDGLHLLAADEAANELVVLERGSTGVKLVTKVPVSTSPVSVVVSSDGARAYVASLWARRVTIADVSVPRSPRTIGIVDLPFAPRNQGLLPGGNFLVVADAFGGRLAVIDTSSGKLVRVRKIAGHNLRGLGLTPNGATLAVPHQLLSSDEATTQSGVHWGGVMLNVIRSVSVESLLRAAPAAPPAGDLYYLGYPDRATGDPTGMVITRDGRQILAFSGVSEIAISDPGVNHFQRIAVGRRPTALALSPDERHVYVANTFSDSVSIVEVESGEVLAEISLGPQPQLTAADQGEMLFYDARLSSDGWYSCNSCHPDGHSNGLLNDNLGDESFGAPKRVLSLLGVGETAPWAWNGSVAGLETQIRKSVETTMRGEPPTAAQVDALAAYLRTLRPPPSINAARGQVDNSAVARGRIVFEARGCADCHEPSTYTTPESHDVGLQDELGNRRFNPPSLQGVSQRERLFHDNRASNLRDVFQAHNHGLDEPLKPSELNDLLSFLHSL